RPLTRGHRPRQNSERRIEVGDGLLLVVGAHAAHAAPIGDAEIVVGPRPVLRVCLAGPKGKRGFEMGDTLFQIVSAYLAQPCNVGTPEAERDLRPDNVAGVLDRPLRQRWLEGKKLLSEADPFLEVYRLFPVLQQTREIGWCGRRRRLRAHERY